MLFPSFFNAGVPTYEIEQSLRFDGSAYLSRTPSAAGTLGTWTISYWAKRSKSGFNSIFNSGSVNQQGVIYMTNASDVMSVLGFNSTGAAKGWSSYGGTGKLRDFSAWYHVLIRAFSSSSSNSYDGVELEIYINGEETGTTMAAGSPSGGCRINDGQAKTIGYNPPDGNYFNGYIAEWHLVDGTAAAVTDFGEFDNNGVWRPIEYTGSHGTQGYYLKFDPSAANGIGHDHSGNGNNWSPTNFTTSGTGTDVMSDTPTTNYATLNPLETYTQGTLVNGNLEISPNSNAARSIANMFIPSTSTNKFYWENKYDGGPNLLFGVSDYAPGTGFFVNAVYVTQNDGGSPNITASGTFSGATITLPSGTSTAGDVIGVSYDPSANSIQFTKNGSAWGSVTGLAAVDVVPVIARNSSSGAQTTKFIINFGQRAFEYTSPMSGAVALNTSNLSAPTVKDGSDYFNTVLYTGTGSYPRAVTGTGFSPDWVWLKSISDGYGHGTYDRVRGVGTSATSLRIDSSDSEGSAPIGPYIDMDSLDSDGFTLGNTVSGSELFNLNTKNYVAWNWKAANSSGSSISTGSIDGTNPTIASTVSANPTAGFSIVTYAGSSTGGDTIAHGLGVPPKMIIAKSRGGGTYPAADWAVYHEAMGASLSLTLNGSSTAAGPFTNPGTVWYNTAPTSTHFYVGNLNETNGDNNYVAYCFAEVEGYSKFDSYTGNGNADGPFVYCGFKPRWIMTRAYTRGSEWVIWDTARNPYNLAELSLQAQSASNEASVSFYDIDILSNGFKVRTAYSTHNQSSESYLFVAFAENPFGGDGVSPATAR